MINVARVRLIFHGSVVMLVALACGIPSVVEVLGGTARMWQAAHSALLAMAVWMLAEAAILGWILLNETERAVLTWTLVLTGYSLSCAAIVQAVTGVRALSPGTSVLHTSVFAANLVVVLGSTLSASITLMGARKAAVQPTLLSESGSASAAEAIGRASNTV